MSGECQKCHEHCLDCRCIDKSNNYVINSQKGHFMTCAPSHHIPERKPNGRPREHDRDQIALDLIEWAKKPDSINLCKFCAYYDPIIPPNKMTLWAKECPKFRQSYETAKAFLGFRREEWLNQEHLHVKAYDLNAETYDYFLKEEKLEKEKRLADYAKDANSKGSQAITINLTDYSKDKS